MKQEHHKHNENSLAEKTLGEINDRQKDILIISMADGFKNVSIGAKYFLASAGITAAVIGVALFIKEFILK